MPQKIEIKPAEGKLGVLLPGLGAVSTTFIAGVMRIRKGLSKPYGSVSQMQTIRLGGRDEKRYPLIKDFVPLANLKDIEFAAWDIFEDNAYEAAIKAGVLDKKDLEDVRKEMDKIKPMKAVFDRNFVKNLDGTHVKSGTKWDLAEQVREDIRKFRKEKKLARIVTVWCGSTEVHTERKRVHETIESFEKGLRENSEHISPSMIYAYASIMEGVPYANGAPHLTTDIPALEELAIRKGVPISGKDFKTGQTLLKTVIAPGLKARMLGVKGWFSTNILGNRDGLVLDDPGSFRSKEISKKSALEFIFQPEIYPDLYKNAYHKVRINYYPPKGDDKEGWDNIDIFGWLGYPMQIKVNFLCKDSILAAPIVLDLALFMDLAQRAGFKGIQEWLSFYYKAPMHSPEVYPEHDLFIQHTKLKNTLRRMMGEEFITHLGLKYYGVKE
ncbi:MAG: inositol-3-phosphate synthase [Candidatus Aenigmarchaeota archaeon]|nr:inositol-3-phosphate synthase [Candidatus Aenigmarchaeota archaeon]NIP40075.1 inositol-3-phosphate synthase [Candidatus Aenigmarchaeota archaeon]NIQ18152.1 inositol-3-phosphate synthase [Candidatus Aenigmarchaeota archaeon]NIS72909.1 inositol-3-phosphate synthase [Candidatus Aenigmarchaeota archaeon]